MHWFSVLPRYDTNAIKLGNHNCWNSDLQNGVINEKGSLGILYVIFFTKTGEQNSIWTQYVSKRYENTTLLLYYIRNV